MTESISPTSSNLLNVDNKPDSSKYTKVVAMDNVNQNKDFEKSGLGDKFKDSPLLAERKEQKIINSPPPVDQGQSSEEKILNSPSSGRSSKQEFRLINPTSRSASVSSQIKSPPPDQFLPERSSRNRSNSDNDSLNDDQIRELLAAEEAESSGVAPVEQEQAGDPPVFEEPSPAMEIERLSGDKNSPGPEPSEELPINGTAETHTEPHTETHTETTETLDSAPGEDEFPPLDEGEREEDLNGTLSLPGDEDLDETIPVLEELGAECDKADDGLLIVPSEDALTGLLDISEISDELGFPEEENTAHMTAWIDESIENLKGILMKTLQQRPSKRRLLKQPACKKPSTRGYPVPAVPAKKPCDQKRNTATAAEPVTPKRGNTPLRNATFRVTRKTPGPKTPSTVPPCNAISSDSPLSRFSQPYEFEQRLAAKLTLESMKGYKQNRHQSPEGTKTRKTISQSTSGDFTGSSRNSPVGEYQSNYTSGSYSNFNSEPVSRSYTPSYTASYTPSEASDASDDESPISPEEVRSPRRSASGGLRPQRSALQRGGRGGSFRGRATGIARIHPSYSGELLRGLAEQGGRGGNLVPSSSGESFMSGDQEPQQQHLLSPRQPAQRRGIPSTSTGLKRPTAIGRGQPSPRGAAASRPGNLALRGARGRGGGGIPGPTPRTGIPKPGASRGSGIARPSAGRSQLRRPGPKKAAQWDDNTF